MRFGHKDAVEAKLEGIHLVYRINLLKNWRGEFILSDNNRVFKRNIVNGPPFIAMIQNHYGKEDTGLEKEYALMKLLITFSDYYMEKGRIFPANIEVVDKK